MKFIIENWALVVGAIAVAFVTGYVAYRFFNQPTQAQIANIKEWLLWAVIEAEKEFGSETGKLKLRKVYDMAVARFDWIAYIPFTMFQDWVDEALEIMRKLLAENGEVARYVNETSTNA